MAGIPFNYHDVPSATKVIKGRGAALDVSSITPLAASLLISSYSLRHSALLKSLRDSKDKPMFWHKFTIIKHANCKKEYSGIYILTLVTDFVYPLELLPVYVTEKENKIVFVARNCQDAILKLCDTNLSIPNPLEPSAPFSVAVIKNFATLNLVPVVNLEPSILKVLRKRLSNGLIDLSSFHSDNDLQEFCPLFQPKVLLYVLSLTSKLEKDNLKITKIVLCNNDIRHLPSLESFKEREFTSIDLSRNKFSKIEDITPLKDLPRLHWVKLEGNPLCRLFDSGITYFLYVKAICKNLQTLDTKKLCEDGWYKKHRTFLCDTDGYDFADQFVAKFYTCFDDNGRLDMHHLYHENALFSSTHHSSFQRYSQACHQELNSFIFRDRNFLITGSQHAKFLHIGRPAIEYQFRKVIPAIEHNRHSFFVDLMQYTKTSAIISVTGVFKHTAEAFVVPKVNQGDITSELNKAEYMCGFIRTFVLTRNDSKEWLITNDLWHIYPHNNLLSKSAKWPERKKPCTFPCPSNDRDADSHALTETFESITGMIYEDSKRFLARNNWNLELALKVFIDKHINNEIPDEAFHGQTSESQNSDSLKRENGTQVEEDDNDDVVVITDDDDSDLPSIASLIPTNW